jgi:STE24 endopeptidase
MYGVLVGLVALVIAGTSWIPWSLSATPVSPQSLFTPDQIARAAAYSSQVRVPGLLSLGLSLFALVLMGASRRIRALLGSWGQKLPWWVVTALAVLLVRAVIWVVTLPTGWWAHSVQEQYGLTNQALSGWLGDRLTTAGVTAVADFAVALVILAALRRAGRWWAPVTASLLAGLVVAGSFVYPVVVEPLYNNFHRLPDGPLRTQLMATAASEGVSLSDILVVDASQRTTALNAYVSGFGGSKRLVLYDTLLVSLPPDEINVIVAHEVAHERNQDVLHGTLTAAFAIFAGVNLLGLLVGRWTGSAERRRGAFVWVPAGLAVVAVVTLLVAPLKNAASRQVELRADAEALAATGDSKGFVKVQQALALRSLADPAPPRLLYWWFATHPTAEVRVGLTQEPLVTQ